MSTGNITNTQKLDTAILTLRRMEVRREPQIADGISKTWLSNQMIIQQAIIRDYTTKVKADRAQ